MASVPSLRGGGRFVNSPELGTRADSLTEMVGEILREVGVLVLVFLPLDQIVNNQFTLQWFWVTLSVSIVSLAAGIGLELSRKRNRRQD